MGGGSGTDLIGDCTTGWENSLKGTCCLLRNPSGNLPWIYILTQTYPSILEGQEGLQQAISSLHGDLKRHYIGQLSENKEPILL